MTSGVRDLDASLGGPRRASDSKCGCLAATALRDQMVIARRANQRQHARQRLRA